MQRPRVFERREGGGGVAVAVTQQHTSAAAAAVALHAAAAACPSAAPLCLPIEHGELQRNALAGHKLAAQLQRKHEAGVAGGVA